MAIGSLEDHVHPHITDSVWRGAHAFPIVLNGEDDLRAFWNGERGVVGESDGFYFGDVATDHRLVFGNSEAIDLCLVGKIGASELVLQVAAHRAIMLDGVESEGGCPQFPREFVLLERSPSGGPWVPSSSGWLHLSPFT